MKQIAFEGWSAFNKFKHALRRPTIQAKPKLNKPFIPTGATIVSTKTITKEERESELQQVKAAEVASVKPITTTTKDNIDLGAIPLLTSADDVNGFRATQKSKKKGKKGKLLNANNPPQPVIFNMLEEYDPHRPNDYEQYKEERKELREKQKRQRDWEKKHQGPSTDRSRNRSWSRSRSRSPASYYDSRSPSPEGKSGLLVYIVLMLTNWF
jgi:splicing factor 45